MYLESLYIIVELRSEQLYGNSTTKYATPTIWQSISVYPHTFRCVVLQLITHKDRMSKLGTKDLYNPEDNIATATDYLSELFCKYEDVGLVLDIYNGSSKAFERAKRGELSQYSSWVLNRSSELEKLHNQRNRKNNQGEKNV